MRLKQVRQANLKLFSKLKDSKLSKAYQDRNDALIQIRVIWK